LAGGLYLSPSLPGQPNGERVVKNPRGWSYERRAPRATAAPATIALAFAGSMSA
jgi:hypothetical protein